MKIELEYRRPTKKEYGRTDVFYNHKYLGYFLPNRSKYRKQGENYNFVSKCNFIPSLEGTSKKDIVNKIENYLI